MQSIHITLMWLWQAKYVCTSDLEQALLQKSDFLFPSAVLECQSQCGKSFQQGP